MEREKKLLKNTLIYFIGNFGSKILSILLVPLYSFYILPDELGLFDIIVTTVTMLLPIILLQLTDGMFRWLIIEENNIKRRIIKKSSLCVSTINLLISLLFFLIFTMFIVIQYKIYVILYTISITYFQIYQQMLRGEGKNKQYSFASLIQAVILFVSIIVFEVLFHIGVKGLLLSYIVSFVLSIGYMFYIDRSWEYIFAEKYNKEIIKNILIYSVPLIPNAMCWWIINTSDRYVITFYLGEYSNGIYSMSYKFVSMLQLLLNVFILAWQESAITEYNNGKDEGFFSTTFEKMMRVSYSIVIMLIPITFIFSVFFSGENYNMVWKYVNILYLGTLYCSFASFVGVIYTIKKQTKRAMYTTIIAAFTNLFINIWLINYFNLYAAAISTLISFLLMYIIRGVDVKKQVFINHKMLEQGGLTIIVLVQMLVCYYSTLVIAFLHLMIATIFSLVVNRKYLVRLIEKKFKVKKK